METLLWLWTFAVLVRRLTDVNAAEDEARRAVRAWRRRTTYVAGEGTSSER